MFDSALALHSYHAAIGIVRQQIEKIMASLWLSDDSKLWGVLQLHRWIYFPLFSQVDRHFFRFYEETTVSLLAFSLMVGRFSRSHFHSCPRDVGRIFRVEGKSG